MVRPAVIDADWNRQDFYWHGSRRPIEIGTVLVGSLLILDEFSARVEAVLEQHRPSFCLSRIASVFMTDRPDPDLIERQGGDGDHVYRLEPLGIVARNDVSWWAEILNGGALDANPANDRGLRRMALAYWSGKAGDRPSWEFRTGRARVVALEPRPDTAETRGVSAPRI